MAKFIGKYQRESLPTEFNLKDGDSQNPKEKATPPQIDGTETLQNAL
jgi:hypothetical protein